VTLGEAAERLVAVGRRFDARAWVSGTSGNFSVVLSREPLRLAITPSAAWKGQLDPAAILEIDEAGRCLSSQAGRPSAESSLHLEIVRSRGARAVLHTHSVWSTVLTDLDGTGEALAIEGYEMLKGLEGVTTHEHREWVPILENDQDMARLAGRVRGVLADHPAAHGFLLRRHGLYTWGADIDQAIRHVEILEFLLEAVGRRRTAGPA
jgi:methylthioribulose-1-phosphate dehydratase